MIRHNKFQNHVAESVFTLPAFVLLSVILWWGPQFELEFRAFIGLVLTLLVAYVLAETNNTQQLIRIRTRMMASVWLLLVTCMPFLHSALFPLTCALLLSVSLFLLFRCYQLSNSVNTVFHSFLFLSLGSLCWVPMVWFLPLYIIYMASFLRCLTWRTFWAALFGLVFPYWLWFGYAFWNDSLSLWQNHLSALWQIQIEPFFFLYATNTVSLSTLISWGIVSIFALWSLFYYLQHNYNDKIRVRMMLYIYVCQTFFLLGAMLCFPQYFIFLISLLLATISSLIAHYFSLTGSRFSNFLFCLFLFVCASLWVLNHWLV